MSLLAYLLDPLLKEKSQNNPSLTALMGYFMIMGGIAFGGYFLFYFLASNMGYFEAGGVLCAGLIGIGLIFLCLAQKKKKETHYFDEAMQAIKNIPKGLEIFKSFPQGVEILKVLISNRKKITIVLAVVVTILMLTQRAKKSIFG